MHSTQPSVDRAVVAPASLMTFSGGRTGGEEGTAEIKLVIDSQIA